MSRYILSIILIFILWAFTGLNKSNYSINISIPNVPQNANEFVIIDSLENALKEDNYEQVIIGCKQYLSTNKNKSIGFILNLNILLIKALNYNEQYDEALQQSISLTSNYWLQLEKETLLLKEYYFQRAYTYNGLHNQKYEIDYTFKALAVMQANPTLFSKSDFINMYNDLYYYQNNYEDTEAMSQTFFQYVKFYNSNYKGFDPEIMQYARRVLRKMQITEELTKKNSQKAEQILLEFIQEVPRPFKEKDLAYINACYALISSHYYFDKNYQLAIDFGFKYLEFARENNSPFNIMLAYSKIATSYEQMGLYHKALQYTELSIQSFNFGAFSASLHALQIIKAKCLSGLDKHTEAIILVEQTIEEILDYKYKKKTGVEEYQIDEIKDLNSHNYINIFATSGLLYLEKYKIDRQPEELAIAEKLLRTSTAMFREFYLQGSYNAQLYNLHNKNADGLLYIAIEKYASQPTKQIELLNLIEENASKHLFRNYQYKAGKEIDNVTKNFDDTKLNNVIEQVQTELDADEQVLKYYVSTETSYLLAINKDLTQLIPLAKTESLKKEIFDYLGNVRNINPEYISKSQRLGKLLFPQHPQEKLVVITDNFLNYLPFETLAFKGKNYALNHHQFSYAYSLYMFLWNKQTRQRIASKKEAIVFNPKYTEGSRFGKYDTPNLSYSQKEAQKISSLIQAKLIANKAYKTDFIDNKDYYNLFHFSMHAFIDDEDYKKSCLLFSDNQPLYFEELYQMEIPAKMVVLGACNTGNGKLNNGEGIMSLSLAFSFAGTRATVYSLWEAPDAATSEIMHLYYVELKKGLSKDEALANAKRKFILKNPMMSHPYFWGGFILNGDTSYLYEPNSNIYWIILGISLILGTLFLYLFKRRKLV